eukprot:TRINITY_DN3837_c0_g1_i1.p1 TRINITY_DN3837_c0_g1~~TRINITY_DN3837_c0_g1_i1.p1  ORF type:complete len:236 (+),score=39.05 TRINITY_DN3837_c0_g1_i1:268-975(+)
MSAGWLSEVLSLDGTPAAQQPLPTTPPPTPRHTAHAAHAAHAAHPSQHLQGPYTGILVRVHEKGFGFVESQALQRQYGRDVLVQRSECEQLTKGEQVQFNVEVHADGKLTARNVMRLQPLSPVPAIAAAGAGDWDYPAAYMPQYAGMMPPAKRPRTEMPDTIEEGLFVGTLARVHDKGFGFVNSPQVTAMFQRDALVPQSDCQALTVGDVVEFRVRRSPDGKITAVDVRRSTAGC